MPTGVYKHKLHSIETRQKIGAGNKGKIVSIETRKKISLGNKGKKHFGRKGFPLTREHKKKISDSLKTSLCKKIWVCCDCGKKISWQTERCVKCHKKYYVGEVTYSWKGGITPLNNKIRTSLKYYSWRKKIFIRDKYICQKTGIRGGALVAHHIKNFADFPKLRFIVENGITLSEEAHKEFHKVYEKKNNTKEQLIKFLETGALTSWKRN